MGTFVAQSFYLWNSRKAASGTPMNQPSAAKASAHYDANYGNFQTDLYAEIRREAFGEDIGQSSWITADEQDHSLSWMNLGPGKTLLDVACGSGGPALRIAGHIQKSLPRASVVG